MLRIGALVRPQRDKRKGKGYLYATLVDGKRQRKAAVHVLVLEAWRGPKPSPDLEGCHGNGNRRDNRPENLRWDTRAANRADRERHRRQAEPVTAMTDVSGADGRNEGKSRRSRATSCAERSVTSVTKSVTAVFARFATTGGRPS